MVSESQLQERNQALLFKWMPVGVLVLLLVVTASIGFSVVVVQRKLAVQERL